MQQPADTLCGVTENRGRDVRLLRAVVATVVVIGLAASAHGMGGGAGLTPIAALVLAVVVGPLVWALTRTRTSVPRMLAATAAGQALTHLLLVAMAPSSSGTAVHVHAHDALSATSAGAPASTGLHLTVPMLLAHAGATVLTGLLVTRGADVVRTALRGVLEVVAAVHPAVSHRATVLVDALVLPLDGRVVGPLGGRAPPPQAC